MELLQNIVDILRLALSLTHVCVQLGRLLRRKR